MLVDVGYIRLSDTRFTSAAHANHALSYTLHDLGDQDYVEENSAYNVRGCVQAFLRYLLSVLLDILDASKAAVVIVVVPMQRPSISAKGKRKSLRVPPEHLSAHWSSLKRDYVRDFTILIDLPR